MEKEPQPTAPRLVDMVAREYPQGTRILVSFPDEWELVDAIRSEESSLYVGAFPLERERPSRHQFHGLAPEINVSLVFYRLYKFFQPWPTRTLEINWSERIDRGRADGVGDLTIQLHPVGQAQAWFGLTNAVLWECYLQETRRRGSWQETLAEVWQRVERDIHVSQILTLPQEPTFEDGYTDFLSRLGYAIDPENPEWWSKTREQD